MQSDLLKRITREADKCGGRPCIRGMRIRVQDVLSMLAAGSSESEILQDYPILEPADIRAALTFAVAYMNHSVVTSPTT